MLLSLFLHIYQPPTQFPKVLHDITERCYLKIVELLKKYPQAKITLNINASLTEQLIKGGFRGLVADFADLTKRGQIELTGSAAYHPLLSKLPEAEIRRQIQLNTEINRKYLGEVYQPKGFFPPEMAYMPRLTPIIESLGFEWIILDDSARPDRSEKNDLFNQRPLPKYVQIGIHKGGSLKVFFRDNKLSLGVAFGKIRTLDDLISKLPNCPTAKLPYCILALDGETFGHHQPKQLKLLEELFEGFQLVTISELLDQDYPTVEIEPRESSWGPKTRWDNPGNPLHRLQWQLTELAIKTIQKSKYLSENSENSVGQKVSESEDQSVRKSDLSDPLIHRYTDTPSHSEFSDSQQWLKARRLLDRALHSDQYFWAAHDPCWHPQMVERGARMLRDVVLTVPDASSQDQKKARDLYQNIVETGKRLHGEEVIVC